MAILKKINFKKNYRIELAKTLSGHFYSVWEKNTKGKEKFLGHWPSVTTFLSAYPTSEQLVKWIAEQGFHESRQIRDAAGRAGTKIHLGVDDLIQGNELQEHSYTTEEWVKLKSFVDWYAEFKPEIIMTEIPVFCKKGGYAGRVDCIAKINGEIYVIDWKSSRSIHDSAVLQAAAYSHAIEDITDLKIDNSSIVQLGASNKKGFRFVIFPDWHDHYKVFENVKQVWLYDNGKDKEPPVLVLPESLKLPIP
jgi:hypothetical protein